MKKITITVVLFLMGMAVRAQKEIKVEDAASHEGDSVKICTKIFGAKYFENSNRAPTLLNAGAKYPDAPLTVVVFGESRANFKNKLEEFYTGKQVCITGKIVIYKGKPEIILTSESQITFNE